jgi:hypothetical protein
LAGQLLRAADEEQDESAFLTEQGDVSIAALVAGTELTQVLTVPTGARTLSPSWWTSGSSAIAPWTTGAW